MNGKNSGSCHDHNKTYSIIVNGRPREVTEHHLTYLQVVQLAYPSETPAERVVFTVTYSNQHGRDGSLVEGQKVTIKNGTIFNVNKTDRS
ncbi:multiubiquitin domain-containing protein [Desulfosediminicola ganghwensis]|uniref:multiubiquitin domain-containing protein n=1 Tax=Desulfosediminicola ganghwensis TaxID=2569540 RepID=UPI0010ABC085